MNFQKLPTLLIESIFDKANFETIAKLTQTCSAVNRIIKRKKLDKIDVDEITFCQESYNEIVVSIDYCAKFSQEKQKNYEWFEKSYKIEGCHTVEEQYDAINAKIRQVLNSIKSVKHVDISRIQISGSFVLMLKSLPIQLKDVSASFAQCIYSFSMSDCLNLWKMFKSVDEVEGHFQEDKADVINDQMMFQTLPLITLNSDHFKADTFLINENMTDRTLDFLAENRPITLHMGYFIASFTVDGILNLLRSIVSSRDPNIIEWHIGAVRLNFADYARMMVELDEFETDYSAVLAKNDFDNNALKITVEYRRISSQATGSINFNIILPDELFIDHRRILQEILDDEEVNVEIEDFEVNNNNNQMEL